MTPEAGDAVDDDDAAKTSGADGTTPSGADEPMRSGTDETSQRGVDEPETGADKTDVAVFDLSCTDCSFETAVEGSVSDAFDAADAHQGEHGETPTGHFVNFERRDRE